MATAETFPSTREAIVAAATRAFAEHGYDGTSLNDIADAVGIRRPSLLHHFAVEGGAVPGGLRPGASPTGRRAGRGGGGRPRARAGRRSTTCSTPASTSSWPTPTSCASSAGRRSRAATTSASTSASALRPHFQRAVAFFEREMDAGRFRRQDPEQLLLTGYGALLSYFSDVPFLGALIGEDPLSQKALERRPGARARLLPRRPPALT